MTTTTTPDLTPGIVADSPFLKALVQQIRANDHYGVYRNWSDELVLAPFVVSKEKKRSISVDGDVDPTTQLRVLCFYRAVAALVEKETGKLCQVVIDLSHEGFGWALVWTGRLIVVSRTLRDAQRFGFDSLEKLAAQGNKLTESALKTLEKCPDAANI
jgi:probable nitrogen fixation protein